MQTTQDGQSTRYTCTAEECKVLIRKQPHGTHFMIHIGAPAPIEGTTQEFPSGQSGTVRISRKEALELAGNLLHKIIEDKGGRMTPSVYVSPKSYAGGKDYRAFYVV